jgi:chemotaxis protein CheD
MPSDTPRQKRILHPGEHFVTREPIILSTLLGSCVAACLFDPINRVMGMNHFLLASRNPGKRSPVLESEAGRYGLEAMELLINGLLKQGADRSNLLAKAFGGGNVLNLTTRELPKRFNIGELNIEFVRSFLENDGIPLTSADMGGRVGRQIHFDGKDFSVYVKTIPMNHTQQIVSEEETYFRNTLKHQRQRSTVDFW